MAEVVNRAGRQARQVQLETLIAEWDRLSPEQRAERVLAFGLFSRLDQSSANQLVGSVELPYGVLRFRADSGRFPVFARDLKNLRLLESEHMRLHNNSFSGLPQVERGVIHDRTLGLDFSQPMHTGLSVLAADANGLLLERWIGEHGGTTYVCRVIVGTLLGATGNNLRAAPAAPGRSSADPAVMGQRLPAAAACGARAPSASTVATR